MKKKLAQFACCLGAVGTFVLASGYVDQAQAIDVTSTEEIYQELSHHPTMSYDFNGYLVYLMEEDGHSVTLALYPPGSEEDHINLGTFAADDYKAMALAIAQAIGLFDSPGSLGSYTSNASKVTSLVFQQLVLPTTRTKAEAAKDEARKAMGMPKTLGAAARYERVERDNSDSDGDLYGINLGMAWDMDNMSFGILLPYEDYDFESFDAQQMGLVAFGQYFMDIQDNMKVTMTANVNYMFADVDFDGAGQDDVNTVGGGVGGSLTIDQDTFETVLGLSYQYNTDDSNLEDDYQHLLKAGANVGVRTTDDSVLNAFLVWNYDFTDYEIELDDDDYFEVGAEFRANVSDTWSLSLGLKKVLDLNDFDANQVYLGSIWKF